AFPPRSRTDMPAAEASQCVDATMPNVPRSSGRVVNPPTRDILGAPRTAPPRDDLSRLDVLVHVEEVAGVVLAFDLREPVVVRAVPVVNAFPHCARAAKASSGISAPTAARQYHGAPPELAHQLAHASAECQPAAAQGGEVDHEPVVDTAEPGAVVRATAHGHV